MNEYEKLRIENIKRNNAKLRALGLISELEERRSNAQAEGSSVTSNASVSPKTNSKRKRPDIATEGYRKSLRLQGVGADLQPIHIEAEVNIVEEREKRVKECREVRLKAAQAVAAAGGEKAAKENPTATYEHCLMRVRSMTDKQLGNRVSVIFLTLQYDYWCLKEINITFQ